MYIVKNDNPDVGYQLSYQVTDAEGEVLPNEQTIAEVVSDNPGVVAVDPETSTVHFGTSGLASINATVKRASDGELLGSFGAQFTVTTGDPSAIAGGSIVFEGLTEAEEPDPGNGGGDDEGSGGGDEEGGGDA